MSDIAAQLDSFDAALLQLGAALQQEKNEWVRDAAIQRFEFTFELAWKTISRFARREGLDCPSPRRAVKLAARLGWVEDDSLWLEMLDDRNRTSHTYNEDTAEEIFARLPAYYVVLTTLADRLRSSAA